MSVDHAQFPAVYDQLDGDFSFTEASAAVAAVVADPCAAARADWALVAGSDDVKVLEGFLAAYPGCPVLRVLAEARLEGLGEATIEVPLEDAVASVMEKPAALPEPDEIKPDASRERVWILADARMEKTLDLKRPDVAELQVRLKVLGFDPNGLDGVIGRGLRAAIRDWQRSRSIPVSGYLDSSQLALLESETQDAFTVWISTESNALALSNASNPPISKQISPSPEPNKAKPRNDCISFEGITTCL
jgi:Putative peptidoglycan binding domain